MANIAKQKKTLEERIQHLENDMQESLTKKSSATKEINVGEQMIKINTLKKELLQLK